MTRSNAFHTARNSRYTNFSETPNSRPAQGFYGSLSPPIHLPTSVYCHVATRDIEIGEEILENYTEYDGGEWCNFLSGAWVDDENAPQCKVNDHEKPAKGMHVLFELTKEQVDVLRESKMPHPPGRAFWEALEFREDGSAVITFDMD